VPLSAFPDTLPVRTASSDARWFDPRTAEMDAPMPGRRGPAGSPSRLSSFTVSIVS
jgi:hypothetical protein